MAFQLICTSLLTFYTSLLILLCVCGTVTVPVHNMYFPPTPHNSNILSPTVCPPHCGLEVIMFALSWKQLRAPFAVKYHVSSFVYGISTGNFTQLLHLLFATVQYSCPHTHRMSSPCMAKPIANMLHHLLWPFTPRHAHHIKIMYPPSLHTFTQAPPMCMGMFP